MPANAGIFHGLSGGCPAPKEDLCYYVCKINKITSVSQRCTRAPLPVANASTSASVAIVVSPL